MNVSAIRNDIANVDAHSESHGTTGGLIAIAGRHVLLHFDRAADRSFNAIKHNEQRIARGIDDPAAVLLDCRIDQVGTEST